MRPQSASHLRRDAVTDHHADTYRTDSTSTLARGAFPVLVLEAEERMSIAVIRSLGRAGYRVHACSHQALATGLRSRFATHAVVCPALSSNDFIPWLRRYCATHDIRCIVPTEAVLLALRPVHAEFAPLLPIAQARGVVAKGINKFELFSALGAKTRDANNAIDNLPPMALIHRDDDPTETPDKLSRLSLPLFLKADAEHGMQGQDSETWKAVTHQQALQQSQDILSRFDRVVVQGNVTGIGVGAFLLRWQGRWLAKFMHMRLHEVPGHGWSSYRKSWKHAGILRDAERKLERLDWEGVAMMEYRWNAADDTFALIEMNGRFWGSLHLALYAGVDFPRLLVDAFRGETLPDAPDEWATVYCRDPLLEARYVLSRLRDGQLHTGGKLWSLAEFAWLTLHPKVRSDLLFPGDRSLAMYRLRQPLTRAVRRLSGRLRLHC